MGKLLNFENVSKFHFFVVQIYKLEQKSVGIKKITNITNVFGFIAITLKQNYKIVSD